VVTVRLRSARSSPAPTEPITCVEARVTEGEGLPALLADAVQGEVEVAEAATGTVAAGVWDPQVLVAAVVDTGTVSWAWASGWATM